MFDLRQLLLCGALLAVAASPALGPGDSSKVQGMTISCQSWGREWGSEDFARSLDELVELGVNWIAIHPYASVRADGELRWRAIDPEDPPVWLTRPIREAHARGLSILIKPHLAYWGSPFSWRGEIEFELAEERERFWSDYRRFVLEIAGATAGADALCVGTELDRLLGEERRWRELIAELRQVASAKLTYAANWSDVERVPFWDALDAIGVQAYFPLAESAEPDRAQLLAGWEPVLASLRSLHERSGKPVVFTEFGYNLSLEAARQPWESRVERGPETERAARLQERCLAVGLEVLERERAWLRGGFLWKWFAGESRSRDFRLDRPELLELLRSAWRP